MTILIIAVALSGAGLAPCLRAHPPYRIAVDREGRVFILDWPARRLLRVEPDGRWDVAVDLPERGVEADVHAVALDPEGRLLLAETYGPRIWIVGRDGSLELHPWCRRPDDGFGAVQDLAFGPSGRLHLMRRLERGARTREVRYRLQRVGKDGGAAELLGAAGRTLNLYPSCFAVAPDGTVLLTREHRLLRLSERETEVVAGAAEAGFRDGTGKEARFRELYGLAVAADGAVVLADGGNNRVRRMMPDGAVSTVAGSGERGTTDGPAAEATFDGLYQVALAPHGRIVTAEADRRTHRIRLIEDGRVRTLAAIPMGPRDR